MSSPESGAANFHGNQAENAAESGIRCGTPDEAGAEIVCCGSQSPLREVEHTDPGVSTTASPSRLVGLDLYCCQGGAYEGYRRAGFELIGVDINPQPLYPGKFVQADALKTLVGMLAGAPLRGYFLADFAFAHASPPCQFATVYGNNSAHVKDDHPNLIPATRELLEATGLPYVIENVEGARHELRDPVRICGTGLNVRVRRHRYFETNWPLEGVACDHGRFTDRIFPGSSNRPNGRTVMNVGEYRVPLATQREVMEMPWADLYGISQAVPPAYTEHIGTQLLAYLTAREEVAA